MKDVKKPAKLQNTYHTTMSTPSEVREAQRAARKQRILDNKNDRMSKVKGDYNQHRLHDSDDDEDSRFQHALLSIKSINKIKSI